MESPTRLRLISVQGNETCLMWHYLLPDDESITIVEAKGVRRVEHNGFDTTMLLLGRAKAAQLASAGVAVPASIQDWGDSLTRGDFRDPEHDSGAQ